MWKTQSCQRKCQAEPLVSMQVMYYLASLHHNCHWRKSHFFSFNTGTQSELSGGTLCLCYSSSGNRRLYDLVNKKPCRSRSDSSRSSGDSGSTSSSDVIHSPPPAPRRGRSESQSPPRRDAPNAPRRDDGGRRTPNYEVDRSGPILTRRRADIRDRYRSDDRMRRRRSPSRERSEAD